MSVDLSTLIEYAIVNGEKKQFPIQFNPQPTPTTAANGDTVYEGTATVASPFSGGPQAVSVQMKVELKNENTVIACQFSLPQPQTLQTLVQTSGGALDQKAQTVLNPLWNVYTKAAENVSGNTLIVLASDRCLVDLDFPDGETYEQMDVKAGFSAHTVVNTDEIMQVANDNLSDGTGINAKARLDDAVNLANEKFFPQGTPPPIQLPADDSTLLLGFNTPVDQLKQFTLSVALLVRKNLDIDNPVTSIEVFIKNFSMEFTRTNAKNIISVGTQFTVKIGAEPLLLLSGGVNVDTTDQTVSFWGELFTPGKAWVEPFGLPQVVIEKLVIDVSPAENKPHFGIGGSGKFGIKHQSLNWDVALNLDPDDVTNWAVKAYPPEDGTGAPMNYVFRVLTSATPLPPETPPLPTDAGFLPTFSNVGIYAAAKEITIGHDVYQPALEIRGTMQMDGMIANGGAVTNEASVSGRILYVGSNGAFETLPSPPSLRGAFGLTFQLPGDFVEWGCDVGLLPPTPYLVYVIFSAEGGTTTWNIGFGDSSYDYTQVESIQTMSDAYRVLFAEAGAMRTEMVTHYLAGLNPITPDNYINGLQAALGSNYGAASQCLQNTWQQTIGAVPGIAYSAIAVKLKEWYGVTEEAAVMTLATALPPTMRAQLYAEVLMQSFGMDQDSVATFLYSHLTHPGPRGPGSDPNFLVPGDIPNIMNIVVPGSGSHIGNIVDQLKNGSRTGSSIVEGALSQIVDVKLP